MKTKFCSIFFLFVFPVLVKNAIAQNLISNYDCYRDAAINIKVGPPCDKDVCYRNWNGHINVDDTKGHTIGYDPTADALTTERWYWAEQNQSSNHYLGNNPFDTEFSKHGQIFKNISRLDGHYSDGISTQSVLYNAISIKTPRQGIWTPDY